MDAYGGVYKIGPNGPVSSTYERHPLCWVDLDKHPSIGLINIRLRSNSLRQDFLSVMGERSVIKFCKTTLVIIIAGVLTACATAPISFDNRFRVDELAVFIADDFGADRSAAARALRPVYKKYGAPHAYVSGHMSSVNDPMLNRLYGSGDVRSKLRRDTHTFWQVNGEALSDYLDPIKTAHLVYDTDRLDGVADLLTRVGNLSKQGKVFTIFERELDGQIVVTLHRTDDLSRESTLKDLTFFAGIPRL